MKALLVFMLLCMAQYGFAGNAYRLYLLNQMQPFHKSVPAQATNIPGARFIPAYEIPKGSVFCRMEDKLTRLTGLWIKIGVSK